MLVIGLVLVVTALLATLPLVLKYLLWRAGFKHVQLRYIHPLRMAGFYIVRDTQLSYVRRIHFQLNDLRLYLRHRKLVIELTQPQLVLEADSRMFEEIDFLRPRQQAKLLNNLQNILMEALKYFVGYIGVRSQKEAVSGMATSQTSWTNLSASLKGLCNFTLMLLTQLVEVEIRELSVEFTPYEPEKHTGSTTNDLLRQKALADFTLLSELLTLRFVLNSTQDLEFTLEDECIRVQQLSVKYRELYKTILQIKGTKLVMQMPFTFSFGQSLSKSRIDLTIQSVLVDVVPSNFDEVFDLVFAIRFFSDLQRRCKDLAHKTNAEPELINTDLVSEHSTSEQVVPLKSSGFSEFNILIVEVAVRLTELYEPGVDSLECQPYLSSVSELVATGSNFTMKILPNSSTDDLHIHVRQLRLQIGLYEQLAEVFKVEPFEFQLKRNSSNQLQKLINHGDVDVESGPHVIASLAKIFRLIVRTRRQHYDLDNYWSTIVYFLESNSQSCRQNAQHIANKSLDEDEVLLIFRSSKQPTVEQHTIEPNNTLEYVIGRATFRIKIRKLEHRLELQRFKFRRIYERSVVLNTVGLASLELKVDATLLKEFEMGPTELYVKQTQLLDQCNLFINGLQLQQNQETLVEYLTGFPLVKSLLQISTSHRTSAFKSNSQSFHITGFKLRYLLAILAIDETTLQFQEIEPDMKQVKIHVRGTTASLERDTQIKRARFHFVDPSNIKQVMQLLSVGSVTIRSQLTEGPTKMKYYMSIRDAKLTIPKELVAVGLGLQHCISTAKNLSLYLEAYIRNITDEQLRLIQLNQQNKLQFSANLEVKVLGLTIVVQDSEWNTVFLNYQRTVREYLSNQTIYNEQEIINELNRRKRTYGLVELRIKELSCQLSPIEDIRTVEDAELWSTGLGSTNYEQQDVAHYHHSRLRLAVEKAVLTIRDYPFEVLSISSVSAEVKLVRCTMKPTYQQNCAFYFLKGDALVGEVALTLGLNMSSAFQEIFKRTLAILAGFEKSKQRRQEESLWLDEINKLRNRQPIDQPLQTTEYTPYWEIVRSRCFFSVSLRKRKDTKVSILTGIYPYNTESLCITIKQIYVLIGKEKTVAAVHGIQLSKEWRTGQVFTAVDIGRILVEIGIISRPLIHISCQVVFDSEHRHIVHLRNDLLEHLVNLNQLRTDVLFLYGINISRNKSRFGSIRGQNVEVSLIRWFSYAEIAKFAFDNELQKNRNTLSIWNMLERVQFSVILKEFNVLMSLVEETNRAQFYGQSNSSEQTQNRNPHPKADSGPRTPTFSSNRSGQKQGLQFLVGRCRLKTTFIPYYRESNAEWVIREGSGKINTTVGKYYTGKILRLKQVEGLLARKSSCGEQERYLDDSTLRRYFEDYPLLVPQEQPETEQLTQRNLFFISEALVFIRNHIHESNKGQRLIVKNFFQYERVKVVLSSDIKRVLTRLLKMPSRHDLVVRTNTQKVDLGPTQAQQTAHRRKHSIEQEMVSRRQFLLEKFRRCVKMVINSRKKEKILEVIQKTRLDFLFVLNRPQFNIFYEEKNCQLIVTSRNSCFIELRKQFLPYDTLELDPKICLHLRFGSFEIWTSDQCEQVVWVQPSTVDALRVRQVLEAGETVFSLVDYQLPVCDLNFEMTLEEILACKLSQEELETRKYLWAKEQRIRRLVLELQEVVSRIDRSQKRILLSIIEFIMLMISNRRRFVEDVRMAHAKSNELKIYTKAKVLKKLITKTSKSIMESTPRLETSFTFILNHASIKLLNRELSGQPCFLELLTDKISLQIRQFDCNYFERSCEVEEIQLVNPREPEGSEYYVVLSMTHLGSTAATFQLHSYYEWLFDKEVAWPFHKLLTVKLNPIKLRFSDELYEQLYEYAFRNMEEQAITINRYGYPEQIEEYYNRIIIEPIRVQLWYRSSNLLKRMNGISVTLEQFSKGNRFAMRKQIFDIWVRFVLKQLTRQIFSVLGQKLFGGEDEQDSSDEAEHR